MHATSLLLGTRAGDQLSEEFQFPLTGLAQLIVHVAAALGAAVTSDTAAIEPNDVNASATAITILRNPSMIIRSISGSVCRPYRPPPLP
jgi:hypothetical protein